MASTYSTNLALELIGTGDQAGTWGNTTNTNLGTLIEQAISGYVTQAITDGADTTITIPNGATGVARNMYIECTGTLSANRNLVVPANKKLYLIFNNTSGGFAVTVKVSGQTGVSVPNGKKVILVSNGTDVVNGLNYIADFGTNSLTVTTLTATSANITTLTGTTFSPTTLTATSATITTVTGTTAGFTSANITTLTGTTLGTFASGTITNLTSSSATITSLGVGTAASGTSGEIRATNNVTAYYSSDSRLKENVQTVSDALGIVNGIRGVRYNWTREYIDRHGGEDDYFLRREDIGVIAQEVEAVLPEIVGVNNEGYKAVRYERLVPVLIQAVKELAAKVNALEKGK